MIDTPYAGFLNYEPSSVDEDVRATTCDRPPRDRGSSAGPAFYVASSRDGLAEVLEVAAFLTARGMRNAFAWPEHFTHRCSAETCGIRDRAALARAEMDAAGSCDLFVGIARMGKGTHVELGAALAARHPGKRVILVGVDRADSVFYEAGGVEHVGDVAELLDLLSEELTEPAPPAEGASR